MEEKQGRKESGRSKERKKKINEYKKAKKQRERSAMNSKIK
jgi:hypothetical protein